MAALGEFTLVIDGDRLGTGAENGAQVQVKFSDGRRFIKDADGDKIVFPHESADKPVATSLPFSVDLKTDVASGAGVNSDIVGYEVVVRVPKTGGYVSSGPFAARPAGTTINLADIVSDWTGLITEALAVRAEDAAAAAETAAASVQREQASGVAGLTSAGKLYEVRIPDRLSDATLSATAGRLSGAAADGTTDDSAAFTALMGIAATNTEIGPSDYAIKNTIKVPWWKSLRGVGKKSRLRVPASHTLTGSTLFDLNQDTTDPNYTQFPGMPGTRIGNMVVKNEAGGNLTAFKFNGYLDVDSLDAVAFDRVITQGPTEYCDMVRVSRVYVEAKPDTANYAIDLAGTGGDALLVDQAHVWVDPALGYRAKLLHVRNRRGATIRNIINGDIYVRDSASVDMSSLHMETGQVVLENTSGQVRNGLFYMRGVAGLQCIPVVIQQRSGEAGFNGMAVELSNLQFAYITPLTYPADGTVNFQIVVPSSTVRALVRVRNVVRDVGKSSDSYGHHCLYGVTCGDADFDNYSHLASVESTYRNGAWDISANMEALATSTGLQSSGGVVSDSFRTWAGTSGTYYYKAACLLDKQRRVGRVGSSEQSVALTNGGNGAGIVLANEFRRAAMIRLYRGTSTGSYDKYVDVPLVSGARLHDSGTEVAGYAWVSRTAGAADTLNENLTEGAELVPGVFDANSDAYGRLRAVASTSALPTVGAWRKGDEIVLRNPISTDAGGWLYGWRRLTDCTAAATANVRGTDWQPINSPKVTYTSGSPTGVITGGYGDIAIRTDGFGERSTVYIKTSSSGNTGWVALTTTTPITATTAQLAAIGDAINTTAKATGKMVFNTTTGKPVWANGGAAGDTWKDATGVVAHTPV